MVHRGKTLNEIRNTPLLSKQFELPKALAVASNGALGYYGKLADKLCEILGAESVVQRTTISWKASIEAALQTTVADRRVLVRAFIGGKKKNQFRWHQPLLEALVVFYSTSPAVRSLDSIAKAEKICALACAQFCEDPSNGEFLSPQFVEVSALLLFITLRDAELLQTTLNNLENVRKALKGDAKDENAVKGEAATPTKKRKIILYYFLFSLSR